MSVHVMLRSFNCLIATLKLTPLGLLNIIHFFFLIRHYNII